MRKSITVYQGKLRKIFEKLRTDKSAAVQAVTRDLEKFDVRPQKRVDQIVELAKSMPARADVDKYESLAPTIGTAGIRKPPGSATSGGRTAARESPRRRACVRSVKRLKNVAALESRKTTTADLIKNRNLSAAEGTLKEQELGRIDAMLDSHQQELVSLALPTGTATTHG